MKYIQYLFVSAVTALFLSAPFSLAQAEEKVTGGQTSNTTTLVSKDDIISATIGAVYNVNPILKNYELQITSQSGVVTLRGNVRTEDEKQLATDIANDIKGVSSVKNEISVDKNARQTQSTWGQKVTDATLTSMIKSKLLADSRTSGLKIHVTTTNNVVVLSGNVASSAERKLAERIALRTAGVIKVVNNLTVK